MGFEFFFPCGFGDGLVSWPAQIALAHHLKSIILINKKINVVRMKISVFLAEISAKFRVSEVGETKEGGEMSTEEISVNFAKNRRNFR